MGLILEARGSDNFFWVCWAVMPASRLTAPTLCQSSRTLFHLFSAPPASFSSKMTVWGDRASK